MNADSIKIECEEDGFWLIVPDPAEIHPHRFPITDPEALYDTVKREIGPWLYERDQAKREVDSDDREDFATVAERNAGVFFCDPDESGGYDRSDPKHPAFHSTHADIWDAREGK